MADFIYYYINIIYNFLLLFDFSLKDIVQSYGYIAIFLGSCIEGELIVSFGGYYAYKGILDLRLVMFWAFWGTLIADQLSYHLGRHYGPALLERRPALKAKAQRAFDLLKKYDFWFILSFRFIYGIRVVSPIIIGAAGVDPKRFTLINAPAALLWAIVIPMAGYVLGETIEIVLSAIQHYQKSIFMGAGGLFILLWISRKIYAHIKRRQS